MISGILMKLQSKLHYCQLTLALLNYVLDKGTRYYRPTEKQVTKECTASVGEIIPQVGLCCLHLLLKYC